MGSYSYRLQVGGDLVSVANPIAFSLQCLEFGSAFLTLESLCSRHAGLPILIRETLNLGHFQVGRYRYRSLMEGLYTL